MKRILVADDDHHVLLLLSEILSRSDYDVLHAVDGDQALRMAREAPPDLMLLDIMMPGLDGIEVCRAVKSDSTTAGIKIIMVTAKSSRKDIEDGREAGADYYITKPFKLAELIEKIEQLVRK